MGKKEKINKVEVKKTEETKEKEVKNLGAEEALRKEKAKEIEGIKVEEKEEKEVPETEIPKKKKTRKKRQTKTPEAIFESKALVETLFNVILANKLGKKWELTEAESMNLSQALDKVLVKYVSFLDKYSPEINLGFWSMLILVPRVIGMSQPKEKREEKEVIPKSDIVDSRRKKSVEEVLKETT